MLFNYLELLKNYLFLIKCFNNFNVLRILTTPPRQGYSVYPAGDAACRGREGDPVRPQGGRSAAAGADITRQGREGPRRRPARHAADGVQPNSRDYFRVTAKGEYGGAGGVEGRRPLSPPAPRRGGDLPPVPGSSRRAGEAGAPGGAGKRFYDRQNKFVVLRHSPRTSAFLLRSGRNFYCEKDFK